jgi:hypothetical protein
MGIRDRLETIKTSNVNSYDEFDFQPNPPKKPAPPPIGNPWRSIWFRPRRTIRAIVENNPGYRFFLLVALIGLSKALIRASSRDLGDRVAFPILLALCALLGPILTLIGFSLGAALLAPIGRWLGGVATAAEVRAALAWGSLPYTVVLILWIPLLILVGPELFTSLKPRVFTDPITRFAVFLMYVDDLIMLVWGIVLTLNTLAEVFRMAVWRVILALILMVPPFVAILFVPTILIVGAIRFFSMPPPIPVPTASMLPRQVALRSTSPPSADLGPVVRAIWDDGFRVQALRRGPTDATIVSLVLAGDVRMNVNDAALQHLRDLPALEELEISQASEVSDSGLRAIRDLTQLTHLEISFASISDEGLENCAGMTRLKEFILLGCDRVRGPGLVHLGAATKLQKLSLVGSQVHGKGLAMLPEFPWLTELYLGDTGLNDDDLAHLTRYPRLEKLDLAAMNPIRGPGLVHLKSLTRLNDLDLSNDPITDDAIDNLSALKGLHRLDVAGTAISPAGLDRLRKAMPGVLILPKVAESDRTGIDDARP